MLWHFIECKCTFVCLMVAMISCGLLLIPNSLGILHDESFYFRLSSLDLYRQLDTLEINVLCKQPSTL